VASNYTANINIAIQGQQALDRLNATTNELSRRLDEIAQRRFGPNASLNSFNRSLDEAVRNLNRVTIGTTDEAEAVRQYVRAVGLANAARQRQNDLIEDQILREQGLTEELVAQAAALRDLSRAEDAASQARNARLAQYARLRGAPDAYSAPIGPITANEALQRQASELREAEQYIARIRHDSLRQSVQLEEERLRVTRERRREEERVRDAVLDAVTFGQSEKVKQTVQDIGTGTQNALIRGGLTAGTLALGKGAAAVSAAAGGVAAGMTAHTGPLSGVQNIAGEAVVGAVEKLGGAFNDALGGVPDIINHILQGIGDIPTAMGAAVVAAMAFGPAMKTAAEATYEAGKAVGNTGLGKAVKETLDSQTNLFEDVIGAASAMQMEIKDTTGLHLELGKAQIETALENMTFQKKQNALEKDYNTELEKSVRIIRERARAARGGFKTEGPLPVPGYERTKKSIGKMGENLALGAGFPLLFGGGAGSVLGSVLGSFVGTGFGGQILGGALGQALDQAVLAAARLANTLATVGSNFSQIREEGVYFTAELEQQVRAAREIGNVTEARRLTTAAVTAQTGDVGGLAGQGAAAAVNELQKAWSGVTKAIGTTLSIIAGPFIFALNAALRLVQAVFFLVNGLATGLANLINRIPGAKQLGDALYEQSLKGTEQYENQLAELDKQIKAEYTLVQLAKVRTGYLERMLGSSKVQQEILNKQADAAERLKKFEQEIKEFRASAPDGTSQLRKKAQEQENQMRLKFAENEKQILLKDATELYNTIVENNKRIAEAQRAYDQQRRDMVREAARAQADFDLQVVRRVQDARMRMREQELNYVQKIRQEELKTRQLLDRERQLQRSVTGALSADPEQAEIINTVQTAVENYRAGRMAVEEEARSAQEKAQLEYSKAQIQIERYKYDNALRINRANEDSQTKIARINDQIRRQNEEVSKREFSRQITILRARIEEQITAARVEYFPAKAAIEQERAKPGTLTPADLQFYETTLYRASITLGEFDALLKKVNNSFSSVQAKALQPMGALPTLTDTSGAASSQETAANKQLLAYEMQIQKLRKINGLKAEDIKLAESLLSPQLDNLKQLDDIIKAQKDRAAYEREYGYLLRSGVKPELAEQLVVINEIEKSQLRTLNYMIQTLEKLNDPALQSALEDLRKLRTGVTDKAAEARAGVIADAPGKKIQEFISNTRAELEDTESLAIRVAEGIGSAFSDSFKGIVSGTMTAQEALANFFQSVADQFLDMAAQIIAKWIQLTILNSIFKIFPGANAASAAGTASQGLQWDANLLDFVPIPGKAKGGPVTGGMPYMVGERGPELFVPGRSGTIVPNNQLGAGENVSVVVNVDAKGTSVQGNDQQGNQLGRAISAAVQAELIKQKRPGGLLAV
jgi:hypothetical protein